MKRILVFLDTETTGTDKVIHGIHQLSGMIEVDGKIVESFDLKFRPFETCEWSDQAMETCGKTKEEIQSYDDDEQTGLLKFITILNKHIDQFNKSEKALMVGFNIKFDFEMILALFVRNDEKFFFSYFWSNPIDAMAIAGVSFINDRFKLENFKLLTVANQLEIELDETKLHDALYDIEITRAVYYKALVRLTSLYHTFLPVTEYVGKIPSELSGVKLSDIDSVRGVFVNPYGAVCMPEGIVGTPSPSETSQNLYDKIMVTSEVIQEHANKQLESQFDKFGLSDFLEPTKATPIDTGSSTSSNPSTNTKEPKTMHKINDLSETLTFGKHSGKSIALILKLDPQYIIWLHDNHIRNIFIGSDILTDALKNIDKQTHKRTAFTNDDFLDQTDDLPF